MCHNVESFEVFYSVKTFQTGGKVLIITTIGTVQTVETLILLKLLILLTLLMLLEL